MATRRTARKTEPKVEDVTTEARAPYLTPLTLQWWAPSVWGWWTPASYTWWVDARA
jgi:hypothetical protein